MASLGATMERSTPDVTLIDEAGLARWREHAPQLTRFATMLVGPDDASDLVSAVFLRCAERLDRVDDERGYLIRALTNAAIDQHRRTRRRQARELLVAAAAPPSTGSDRSDDAIDVRVAVAALSIRQRAVVYLTYWEDLDGNQAAAILGIGAASVRRHLARAKTHLRRSLA